MIDDLRITLHSAYTLVRSVESNRSIAAITLDHLIQESIDSIKKGEKRDIIDAKGESVGNRISKIDALEQLEESLNKVVEAVEQAGDDEEKLSALGIYEVAQEES